MKVSEKSIEIKEKERYNDRDRPLRRAGLHRTKRSDPKGSLPWLLLFSTERKERYE